MAQDGGQNLQSDVAQALSRGRREGLAIAALVLSFISFLNLLGAEKSILAMVLAGMALSASTGEPARRQSFIAIGLSLLHIVTIAVVLLVFRDELGELIRLLRTLA